MALKSKHEFPRLKQELLKSGCHGFWLGDWCVCWQRQIWSQQTPQQLRLHIAFSDKLTHSLTLLNFTKYCKANSQYTNYKATH